MKNLRIKKEQEKEIEEILQRINKILVLDGKRPYTESQFVHSIIDEGLEKIKKEAKTERRKKPRAGKKHGTPWKSTGVTSNL